MLNPDPPDSDPESSVDNSLSVCATSCFSSTSISLASFLTLLTTFWATWFSFSCANSCIVSGSIPIDLRNLDNLTSIGDAVVTATATGLGAPKYPNAFYISCINSFY